MKLQWVLPGFLLLSSLMHAQSRGTAHQGIRLQAYGMGSYVRPDFGDARRNAGATVGGTINAFAFKSAELGLDLRAVGSGGRVSKEYFYGAGPRLQYNLGNFEPYAAFHIGYGKVVFQQVVVPGYTFDNSLVTGIAGGLDYRLSRTWAIRGEAERQSFQFNSRSATFHPLAISVGLRYQFHFHNKYGPE